MVVLPEEDAVAKESKACPSAARRALEQLGKTAKDHGDLAQARGHWQAAIVVYEHANDRCYAAGLRRRMARDFPAS
jgi:hypothetical protein